MSNYGKLRNAETQKELPKEFVEEFEKALSQYYKSYVSNGQCRVDSFEDNSMELAYSKGFLAGCIYVDNLNSK